MSSPAIHQGPDLRPIAWISGLCLAISAMGLCLWLWLLNNRDNLPEVSSRSGKQLLRNYQTDAHAVVVITLFLATLTLCAFILNAKRRAPAQPRPDSPLGGLLKFAKEQPVALALFAAYTATMVHGTTWLYPELVGWYRDVIDDHLLNNFALHSEFIGETMRRDDFRFFPLAHQDLHILSWFTPFVTVWMLVSAAELITIVVLSTRFIRKLCSGKTQGPGLLLITSVLFMFHPATAQTFFQLIYSERLLALILTAYICAYLHYQHTRSTASFYSTCLLGLIGIFLKDIALILFIGPPMLIVVLGSIGLIKGHERWSAKHRHSWIENYRLELWLMSLIPIFCCSYIVLSLLPSSYVNAGSYAKSDSIRLTPDWRCWFLMVITSSRLLLATLKKLQLQLLDVVNMSALGYAAALGVLVGFHGSKYLALPVQLVTVLNLTWLWSSLIATQLPQNMPRRLQATLGSALAMTLVMTESNLSKPSFGAIVTSIKQRQASWLGAFERTDQVARSIKRKGKEVNIIYSENSWFSHKRHLGRLKYDRLIEYDPETNNYLIEDGINEGEPYTPSSGDIVINIDEDIRGLDPIIKGQPASLIYRHNSSHFSGAVFLLGPES